MSTTDLPTNVGSNDQLGINAARVGCPCLYVGACSYACTCVSPVMSGGCRRCATYGSYEQRKANAARLAQSELLPANVLVTGADRRPVDLMFGLTR